jgi:hypothetical protein
MEKTAVKFRFTAEFPVTSGRFVAVAECGPASPLFELVKEGKARSLEVQPGRTVFHNYPDEAALKGMLKENSKVGLFLDIIPVRFNTLDDLRASVDEVVETIFTWTLCSPVAITFLQRETTVGQDESVRQQFDPAVLSNE